MQIYRLQFYETNCPGGTYRIQAGQAPDPEGGDSNTYRIQSNKPKLDASNWQEGSANYKWVDLYNSPANFGLPYESRIWMPELKATNVWTDILRIDIDGTGFRSFVEIDAINMQGNEKPTTTVTQTQTTTPVTVPEPTPVTSPTPVPAQTQTTTPITVPAKTPATVTTQTQATSPVTTPTHTPVTSPRADTTQTQVASPRTDSATSTEGAMSYVKLKRGMIKSDTISNLSSQNIDPNKREAYLSDTEFKEVFKMSKEEFYALPKWKQDQKKKETGLH